MKKLFVSIIVVVVVVAGYIFFKSEETLAPGLTVPMPMLTSIKSPVLNSSPLEQQNIVTYTDSGYSPNSLTSLTIKSGETVTFKNESSKTMWTASSGHPSHMDYDGSSLREHCQNAVNASFDSCAGIQPGNSWQFTFSKKGMWKFHNHLSSNHYGSVTVE